MDLLSRKTLEENAAKLINTTAKSFSEYSTWKNEVLSEKENIFPILETFLTEKYTPQMQVFLINIIKFFITTYSSSLPLFEIQQSLFSITDQIFPNEYSVLKVGELIALIIRLIYQREKSFIIEIDKEKNAMNLLECSVYCSLCTVFDEPQHDVSQDVNIEIQNFFANEQLNTLAEFAVRTIPSNAEYSLRLLISCLEFRVKKRFHFDRKSFFSYPPPLLNQLLERNLFNNLTLIVQNAPPAIGADAVKIVMYIASSMSSSRYPELQEGIINFIGFIINSPAFFTEPVRVAAFGNLMATTKICTSELLSQLVTFFIGFLESSFINVMNIFQPCLDCYVYFTQSRRDIQPVSYMSSVLHCYVVAGLASFETNTAETYSAIFDNREQTSQTIDILLLRSNASCADTAINIGKTLEEIAQQPFTVVTNCQMAFLIQIAISAINNFNIFVQLSQQASFTEENTKPNYLQPLIESVFTVINQTQDHVLEYNEIIKASNSPFPFEVSISEFIRDYFTKFFSQVPIPIFSQLPVFSNVNEMIYVSFIRDWTDILNDIECKEISIMFKSVTNPKVHNLVLETEIPNIMLENFMAYPPKSVILDTICMIMSLNPDLKSVFFSRVKENFPPDTEDNEKLNKLFRILKGLFFVTKECNEWRELYIFFDDNFSSLALKADLSLHGRIILKLLHTILITKFPQQPFRTRTTYQFNLFHFITQMLEKLSQVMIINLRDLGPSKTLFSGKLNGSSAISLEEAHVMTINDEVDVEHISLGSDPWDIATFIVSVLNKLMISPFPNFGIISYYKDNSHFRIIDIIMEKIGYTSQLRALELLRVPHLVQEILKFYSACLDSIIPEAIDDINFERILTFSRAALVSNNIQTIQAACKALLLLIEKLTDHSVLAPHAVLSFGIVINQTQDDALDFISKYYSYDSDLLATVVEQIAGRIPEQQSIDFKELFNEFLESIPPKTEKNFSNVVVEKLRYFVESVQEMNIHISQFPEFASCFVFSGPE